MRRRGDQRLTAPMRAFVGCGGLTFALCGLLPTWFLSVRPATELVRSLSWPAERCEVLYAGVERAGGDYRPLVAFAWQAGGRERVSARFEVLPNDYKKEEQARAQAADYKAGQRAECFVDPARSQAVLKRRPNTQLFLGLVPLLFLLPAAPFLWLATRPGGRVARAADASSWLPGGLRPEEVAEGGGPVTLAPASTPLGRFLGLLAGMLVWNGLTGVFVAATWSDFSLSDAGLGLLCFAAFPLIGLLLLGATVYRFFALFGPRAFLTLSRPALRPGEAVTVSWELRRMAWRARDLEVTLLGREAARAGEGSPSSTHVFLERRLQPLPGGERTAGRAVVQLPPGLMHSFEAGGFELEWLVRVRAPVLMAPDLDEEFPLLVLPGRPA